MSNIKSVTMTCEAAPSQWDIELEDGRYVYARYRWGNLGFGIGKTPQEAVSNYNYGKRLGGEYDGVLSTDEMLPHLHKFLKNVK
jgi:hypothetical protein